ncbi:MAG: hypothetical protein LBK76_03530 [Verrucomicrobiales bacterium]|jgi:hypothetical protein|nr:hypothetical protein [Verrucomicrobiales bacterium]
MSEQSDAVNKVLRERGVAVPSPEPSVTDGEVKDERALPTIELIRAGRRLSDFAREAGGICAAVNVFRRETAAVTVNEDIGLMEPLDADRFRTFLEEHALTYFLKYDKNAANGAEPWKKVECTMSVQDARGCLRADQFVGRLPKLKKVNAQRQPVMRADGAIVLLPAGYDAFAEIFTLRSPVVIDEAWSLDRAVAFLRAMLKEFPFLSPRDLAVHVVSMVSMFAPDLLGFTSPRPSFIYSANKPGSGKTLLVNMAVATVMGSCESLTIPEDKNEFRKTLDSAVMNSVPYLFFDELEGVVKNGDLNAFITSDFRTGRLFNKQSLFRAPRMTVCYLAGNNLTLQQDIARRSLECKLHIEQSNSRDRKIEHELSNEFFQRLAVRGDFLSALWALVRAWDVARRPVPPTVMKGFVEWSRVYGGIVWHAGFGDALVPPPIEESGDNEAADMALLVEKLSQKLGIADADGEVRFLLHYDFDEVIAVCVANNCFAWMIERVKRGSGDDVWYDCKPAAASRMGKLLADKYGGSIFNLQDGRRVRFSKRGRNRQRRYDVELLDGSTSSVPPPTSPAAGDVAVV